VKIMLIRHAEKPDAMPPFGVKPDGTANKHSILVRGWQRAGALVPFFVRPADPKVATPEAIFAATTAPDPGPGLSKDDARSLRPVQTIGPLAAKLGCPLRTDISVGDEDKLIAALRATQGVVLVAWEHKRIPTIAQAFSAKAPADWGDGFDVVWVLDRNPDRTYDLSIVYQALLAGDRAG
jgi:hypothetical protein